MEKPDVWKVLTPTVHDLEASLNALAQEGYEVFNVFPMGAPEPASHIPREHKSLEERTTFAVLAVKRSE